MPLLTRMFVKAGLAYFVAALGLGALLFGRTLLNLPAWVSTLQPVYLHLFMVGWVTQLIFGVAYWMFPKLTREQPRGSERLGWAVFVTLNAGLLLRVVSEPLATLRPELGMGWMLVLSAGLQLFAGLAFVANTWGRVKER